MTNFNAINTAQTFHVLHEVYTADDCRRYEVASFDKLGKAMRCYRAEVENKLPHTIVRLAVTDDHGNIMLLK